MDSAVTTPQTAIRESSIMVKNKRFHVRTDGENLHLGFKGERAVIGASFCIDDLSLTVWKEETYLDTGLMLFGPIDDQAAKTINELLTPTTAPATGTVH